MYITDRYRSRVLIIFLITKRVARMVTYYYMRRSSKYESVHRSIRKYGGKFFLIPKTIFVARIRPNGSKLCPTKDSAENTAADGVYDNTAEVSAFRDLCTRTSEQLRLCGVR